MPIWNPSGAPLVYHELDASPDVNAPASAWTDWDMSGFVPAGAKYAEVTMYNGSAFAVDAGVREKGSAVNKIRTWGAIQFFEHLVVGLDVNRFVECWNSVNMQVRWYCTGYWS